MRRACMIFCSFVSLSFGVSCSSGGGGGGADSAPGVVTGSITGFGSVFVNGIKFDTRGATFTLEGEAGSEADLRLGMIVSVVGTVNRQGTAGKAESITFDDSVEGTVDSVDVAGSTLSVLGQTVVVDELTVFEDTTLETLAVGNVVEVSGLVDSDGRIHASRIELEATSFVPGADELEVEGAISSLDEMAMTFVLNGLTVDYSGARLDDIPRGGFVEGLSVEVKSLAGMTDGRLIASRVEAEDDDVDMFEGDKVEIEGFITSFTSASEFEVDGHAVETVETTVFRGGTAADLALNRKVEVEGTIDERGVLVASSVSLRRRARVRIEADIAAVGGGRVTVLGVPGIDVIVDSLARLEDESDERLDRMSLADLRVGDRVEIRAARDENGDLVAARLEREDRDDDEEVSLRGPVEAIEDPDLTILGIRVRTDARTEFEGLGEDEISGAEFFASLAPGSEVKAEGRFDGSEILADEVELED